MGVRWIAIYFSNNHDEAVAAGFNLRLIREIFVLIMQPKHCGYIFRGSRVRVEYNLKRRTQWEIH